ncbi:MAG: ABC transporter ATP-binding protein [Planctomycetes bacterium]|nr:ABC transporter ATP-binding protein [Planctomycetota bacterium]
MIVTENLTKRYYNVVALDRISFEVGKGEIVGFLGPNGAGKSTTLKILTCFLPATSGTARVAGFDVFSQSMQVREQVGYLPENVPLYGDMRVQEYLFFRGRLKGLSGREARKRIDEVCDLCGLKDMTRRMVGHLSKGYRQRVGLADVLIHHPPILLLDEPTGGLDPTQRKEVRDLIARLGDEHTLLLSSHILAEVESVCTRVLILKKGRIIADGKPENLVQTLKGGEKIRIHAACEPSILVKALAGYKAGIVPAKCTDQERSSTVWIDPGAAPGFSEDLLRHLVLAQVPVVEFVTQRYTLEEIFMHLTVEEEVLGGQGLEKEGAL